MHPLFSEFLAKDHQDQLRGAAERHRLLREAHPAPPAHHVWTTLLALVPVGAMRTTGRPTPSAGRGRRWWRPRPSTRRPGRLPLGVSDRFAPRTRPRQRRRTLGTVVFSDIVASTEMVRSLGDRAWMHVIEEHDRRVDGIVACFGGRRVRHTGDGVVGLFDLPGRALRCAEAMHGALGPLRINVRVGVHTGEIELVGDDIAGLTVHVAARVMDLAPAGETWTSSTVRDLVVGDDVRLVDEGVHMLRGLGDWRLCSVDRPVTASRAVDGPRAVPLVSRVSLAAVGRSGSGDDEALPVGS